MVSKRLESSVQGRVLILEPDSLLRWSLVTYLSQWFDVCSAETGGAAERILEGKAVDALVVSDQLSPGTLGSIEARARKGNAQVRVVHTVTSAAPGVPGCLEKPFSLSTLAGLLGVEGGAGKP